MKHKLNTGILSALLILLVMASFRYEITWYMVVLPCLLWLGISAIGSSFICSGYHLRALCGNKNAAGKQVALTFDDGPHPETDKVLDLLKRHNSKATFFCIGMQIEKYPEIFKRIITEGHTVGNHSYSHSQVFGFLSGSKVIHELQQTDELITKHTSKRPLFFRPPFGATSPAMATALRTTGHTVIGWNIRSLDTIIKSEEKILNRIERRLAPGSIILLHDTSVKTVNVLEQLLVLLKENNYEPITVDQLLNIPAYED